MGLDSMDMNHLRDAIDDLGDAFETILYYVRQLPKSDRDRFLNPESLGYLSAFLGCGHGFEPALPSNQFNDCEMLIAICDHYEDEEESPD